MSELNYLWFSIGVICVLGLLMFWIFRELFEKRRKNKPVHIRFDNHEYNVSLMREAQKRAEDNAKRIANEMQPIYKKHPDAFRVMHVEASLNVYKCRIHFVDDTTLQKGDVVQNIISGARFAVDAILYSIEDEEMFYYLRPLDHERVHAADRLIIVNPS